MPDPRPVLRCAWVDYDAARQAVRRWHYSRSLPAGKIAAVGAWEDGRFLGVVIFSRGANRHIGSPFGLDQTQACELTRVALDRHTTPVSRILALALRFLHREFPGLRLVVSYADTDQGHHGGIYQASGWIYTGKVLEGARDGFIIHGRKVHPKTVESRGCRQSIADVRIHLDPSATEHRGAGKHKYLMPLDAAMRAQVAPLGKPYPKRAGSADSGTAGSQPAGDGATPIPALHTSPEAPLPPSSVPG